MNSVNVHTINCGSNMLVLHSPVIMGILNITPDSFSDGGKYLYRDSAIGHALQMVDSGAQIIDVGAASSKPGAPVVNSNTEIERLGDIISSILQLRPRCIVSIDTYNAATAQYAAAQGATMINDISAGTIDTHLHYAVAEMQLPYVLMHMRGTPQTMQSHTQYDNVVHQVVDFFARNIQPLKHRGIHDIILDVGFGFGKSIDQNFELLNNLEAFLPFQLPMLVGMSRKSMMWRTLMTEPNQTVAAGAALQMVAMINGAKIIRTHDVEAAVQALAMYNKLHNSHL